MVLVLQVGSVAWTPPGSHLYDACGTADHEAEYCYVAIAIVTKMVGFEALKLVRKTEFHKSLSMCDLVGRTSDQGCRTRSTLGFDSGWHHLAIFAPNKCIKSGFSLQKYSLSTGSHLL